jgi:hypothetical protein
MSEYGFWKVAAWVVGVPLGLALLGLLIILSPQIWSSLQEAFSAPLTFGGAFLLIIERAELARSGSSSTVAPRRGGCAAGENIENISRDAPPSPFG